MHDYTIDYTNDSELCKHFNITNVLLQNNVLSQEDFAPPQYPKSRQYHSNVVDIKNGDNYYDYAEYFFKMYGENLFDT